MIRFGSIFQEFNLPNATTWFYFSMLLAVALFFKFSRVFSIRSWDVLTLFLLVPGFLLLQEAQHQQAAYATPEPVRAAGAVLAGAQASLQPLPIAAAQLPVAPPKSAPWFIFIWLVAGSGYFLIRCLVDLTLVQRPALAPNLNFAGLAWLAGALFICLVAVAVRKSESPRSPVIGKRTVAVDETQKRAEGLVKQGLAPAELDNATATFWVERVLAMSCHLAIVVGLVLIGTYHFQDATSGMAAATFYLLLPYTAYHVEQIHHVWPAALIVWTVVAYRRPVIAGLLLGIATGTAYFPGLLFPAWLGFYWRRGAGRFFVAYLVATVLSLGLIATTLFMEGQLARTWNTVLSLSDWQPWLQPTADTQGFWTSIPWAWVYRMPVFIIYLAFALTTTFWPATRNLAQVMALSAALLIGVQFWYADQGGVYILWYLPLVLLLVFRPNLTDRRPPEIDRESDWLYRAARWVGRRFHRLLRLPEPALVRVP